MEEQIRTITISKSEVAPLELEQVTENEKIYISVQPHVSAAAYLTVGGGNKNSISIELKEGSKLEMFTYNTGSSNDPYETDLLVGLEENAEFTLYNLLSRDSSNTANQTINLKGNKATAVVCNYIIGIDGIRVSNNVKIHHLTSETISKIENYVIAKDTSKIFCDNDTIIYKGSKLSNAYQKTKGLTIGDDSGINVRPVLHIDEFDVLAGHGASIGSMSKDDLFYLMSRGLTKVEAEKLAIEGMVKPFIDQIKLDPFRTMITKDLDLKLK